MVESGRGGGGGSGCKDGRWWVVRWVVMGSEATNEMSFHSVDSILR